MLGNNKTSFTLIKDPENQHRIKHIDVMHLYVQDLVKKGELEIKWMRSLLMLAGGVTKAFYAGFFVKH